MKAKEFTDIMDALYAEREDYKQDFSRYATGVVVGISLAMEIVREKTELDKGE